MIIEVKELTKVMGGQRVLAGIDLRMRSGIVYGLQGINGSGKTMLMRAILGLIRPSRGCVLIDGKQLGRDLEFPESVGFLLENPTFLDRYSGKDNLRLLAGIRGEISEEDICQVIRRVGLDPEDKKKYRKYSLGMKQRLGLAAAVMEKPDLVILDEPANALDESGVRMLREMVRKERKRGALVLLSCHDRGILEEMSDVIFRMVSGAVVEKTEMPGKECENETS